MIRITTKERDKLMYHLLSNFHDYKKAGGHLLWGPFIVENEFYRVREFLSGRRGGRWVELTHRQLREIYNFLTNSVVGERKSCS